MRLHSKYIFKYQTIWWFDRWLWNLLLSQWTAAAVCSVARDSKSDPFLLLKTCPLNLFLQFYDYYVSVMFYLCCRVQMFDTQKIDFRWSTFTLKLWSDTDISVRQSTIWWRWQTDWTGLESKRPHAVIESVKWSGKSDTEMAFPFYYLINQIFNWSREISSAHLLSREQLRFSGNIWKACGSQINFMNSDEIIPWGFWRGSWEIFNKKGWFDFSGSFCHIWRQILQHYSTTFLCHADFSYLIDPV